jgi:hypothetical protein
MSGTVVRAKWTLRLGIILALSAAGSVAATTYGWAQTTSGSPTVTKSSTVYWAGTFQGGTEPNGTDYPTAVTGLPSGRTFIVTDITMIGVTNAALSVPCILFGRFKGKVVSYFFSPTSTNGETSFNGVEVPIGTTASPVIQLSGLRWPLTTATQAPPSIGCPSFTEVTISGFFG